jgi:hypothetical protein
VHGVAMADVVKREGGTPSMGQSPFALARGTRAERVDGRPWRRLPGAVAARVQPTGDPGLRRSSGTRTS